MSILEDIVFPRINDAFLGQRFDEIRARVAGGASGRVLEIGAGTGLNFRHYPSSTSVVAVEPAPGMRRFAERRGRVAEARAAIELIEGRAKSLPFDAGSFDTVVITFTLCSIKDEGIGPALAEVRRVLRPGGRVRIAEHVKSPAAGLLAIQRTLNPVWRVAFGGCTLLRDVRAELDRAGFDPSGLEEIELPLPAPARPGLVGEALRP